MAYSRYNPATDGEEIKYAKCENDACSSSNIVTVNTDAAAYDYIDDDSISMVLGSDGFAHVAFTYEPNNSGNSEVLALTRVSPEGFGSATGARLGTTDNSFAQVNAGLLLSNYYQQRSEIDTANAFQIQNSTGSSVFTVDTLNNRVSVTSDSTTAFRVSTPLALAHLQ